MSAQDGWAKQEDGRKAALNHEIETKVGSTKVVKQEMKEPPWRDKREKNREWPKKHKMEGQNI